MSAAMFVMLWALTGVAGAETLDYRLDAGPCSTTADEAGLNGVTVDGFNLRGAPDDPLLPVKEYNLLLPPDADFSTVRVTVVHSVSEVLPGLFDIRPAAPDRAMVEGRIVEDWGGAENIVDGKNMDVYGVNAFFPAEVIQLAPHAEMRKYRFLRVEFQPIQYNPITKQLRYTTSAVIDIEFARSPEKASVVNLRDTVLDREAPELFCNYEDARQWYEPPKGEDQPADMSSYYLLIVTTNAIKSGSATSASIGYDGCWDGTLFSSAQCADLDNNHPAVVFQNSCTNGYPENTGNLGYSLLLNGAIGTYSASRVSWYNDGVGYGQFDGSSTNSGIAYEVTRRVAMDYYLGNALYWGKRAVIADIGTLDTRLMNQYDFNLYGDPTVSIVDQDTGSICQTLNDALGNNSLSFVNEGDALWFCQQTYYHAGGDAAQSGDITDNESSSFHTQVQGPGVLSFYWKVDSESGWDYLRFLDNGVEKYSISGSVDWQSKSYDVPAGAHTLKWTYQKDVSIYTGMDCGWVDLVSYSGSPAAYRPMPYLLLLLD